MEEDIEALARWALFALLLFQLVTFLLWAQHREEDIEALAGWVVALALALSLSIMLGLGEVRCSTLRRACRRWRGGRCLLSLLALGRLHRVPL